VKNVISRRRFIANSAAVCAFSAGGARLRAGAADAGAAAELDLPLVDFHVHLDNSTIDEVLELSKERGVKFGIVEHAGDKENKYPVVLSNDDELRRHLALLEGKPVYKGVQAEWNNWMGCFSPGVLAQLDYVLTDAMTFPGKDGRRQKLWEAGYQITDKQAFMDRFVEWHVEILAKEPVDVLANVSWLPGPLAGEYDLFWTPERMKKVVDAAVKYQVAIEISSSFRLPKGAFLKLAKAAGVKFCFGSNGRYPNMGKLEYSLQMAKELGLKRADMFTPAPDGQKAVQRRKWA
jgi:histidinol phosphatase-like PHP family hydrolase